MKYSNLCKEIGLVGPGGHTEEGARVSPPEAERALQGVLEVAGASIITPYSGRDLCNVTPVILHGVVSPDTNPH